MVTGWQHTEKTRVSLWEARVGISGRRWFDEHASLGPDELLVVCWQPFLCPCESQEPTQVLLPKFIQRMPQVAYVRGIRRYSCRRGVRTGGRKEREWGEGCRQRERRETYNYILCDVAIAPRLHVDDHTRATPGPATSSVIAGTQVLLR